MSRRPTRKRRRTVRGGKLAFDSGGMFQGTPATSGSAASSFSSTQLDPGGGYTPLMENVFKGAGDILNRQYQPYDESQRFAGFTPDQLAAQERVRQNQNVYGGDFTNAQNAFDRATAAATGVGTAGQTAFGQAQAGPGGVGAAQPYAAQASKSWTDPGTADAWMNPFTKNVTDATIQQAQTAWGGPGGIQQGLTDTFTGGGAAQFGRNRMADVGGKLATDWSRGLTQALGGINASGYNQGMTAFGNEQQRQAGLAGTMGQLGVGDVTSRTALGTAQTNAAAQGVTSQIDAGRAQTALGQARQSAGYTDAAQLAASGATQQALDQKKKDFAYQQNREAFNFPLQNLQAAQGLGQGWALPTSASSSSTTTGYSNPAQGSAAGQILGGGLAVGAAVGDYFNNQPTTPAPGSQATTAGSDPSVLKQAARGGHMRLAFGPGGMVPVTRAVRQRVQSRMPAIMQRLQPQQGPGGPPGMTPGQIPGMMPGGPPGPPRPRPAFASGGTVDDEAQDREMITRAVHQHERDMHHARQLTKLRLAFGGPVGFADGGSTLRATEDFMPAIGPIPRRAGSSGDELMRPPSQPVLPASVPAFASPGGGTGGTEGTGGVGGSATDGSGGSAAAGVGGDDGGTYARGGRYHFAMGGGMPWMSMAGDAFNIGNEFSNGDQGLTPMDETPYDPAAGIWHTLSGGAPETNTEAGRRGAAIGAEVGDVASMIFPMAAPLFREGFQRAGSGIGEMVGGDFNKGVQNLASGTPFELLFHAARGGRAAFADGGDVDRAMRNEVGLGDSVFLGARPAAAAAPPGDDGKTANEKFYEGLARDNMRGRHAFMHGFSDTMLPGVADELSGGVAALTHPESSYDNELALARAKARVAADEHPAAYYGGMGTGIASSIGGFNAVTKALQALPWFARLSPLKQAALSGAAQSVPSGFGSGEGGFLPRVGNALMATPWGAGMGLGFRAGAKYGPKAYNAVRSAFGG
jgi:hypothetical protein